MLKVDKKHCKGIDIYYTGYITIKKIINSVNPLYWLINKASGYIEEKNGNKYLIFDDSVNKNKRLLKNYGYLWDGYKTDTKRMFSSPVLLGFTILFLIFCLGFSKEANF